MRCPHCQGSFAASLPRSELRRRLWKRGYSYARKGEQDKAIADYTEAIRLDPKTQIRELCDGLVVLGLFGVGPTPVVASNSIFIDAVAIVAR